MDESTGKAACSCDIQDIDFIEIPGIGNVCVTPGDPCEPGEIDCNGGNALDINVVSDHNIGFCAGNCTVTTGQQCGVNLDCPAGTCSKKTFFSPTSGDLRSIGIPERSRSL